MFSDNLYSLICEYYSPSDIDNLSDHNPVLCGLDIDVNHITKEKRCFISRSAWYKATDADIDNYTNTLNQELNKIHIDSEFAQCRDIRCTAHHGDIYRVYNSIVTALCTASDKCIPRTSPVNGRPKVIPGWNDYVKDKKAIAELWNFIWQQNGKPHHGTIANIMRKTKRDYHYAIRYCKKNESQIASTKMAEALLSGRNRDFWNETRKLTKQNSQCSSTVDGITGAENIADLFYDKFKCLYNSVPYSECEMNQLKSDIDTGLDRDKSYYLKDQIYVGDVHLVMKSIKHEKKDGTVTVMSECIIHAPHILQVLLAVLFNSMVIHGTAAEGLLEGSMTPIPKSQAMTRLSDKYRAITLSSLIGKIFDLIILRKQKQSLMSDDLQFGFKEQSSTTLCTNMLLETANHFVSKGNKVYVVFLDASKAFDRVCYTKLFRILERRGMNRLYIRCLIYMYLNQKLCVTWNGIKSEKLQFQMVLDKEGSCHLCYLVCT